MLAAADEFLGPIEGVDWLRPTGGLYVWLRLPEQVDTGLAGPLFDRAVEAGVLYVPGEFCYPGDAASSPRNMVRLSFGIPSCEEIRRGVEALARAVREVAAMTIIDRYLLRQFLQTFLICYLSLTGLYIVFDAFTNLEDFLRCGRARAAGCWR